MEPRHDLVTIYVTKDGIYGYNGEQDIESILDWLSADKFMDDEVLQEDFQEFAQIALGFNVPWSIKLQKWADEMSQLAEKKTKKWFKHVPRVDRWTNFAKVSICAVAFVPPVIFTIFYFFMVLSVWFHNYKVDKKYAKINAERSQVKKDN